MRSGISENHRQLRDGERRGKIVLRRGYLRWRTYIAHLCLLHRGEDSICELNPRFKPESYHFLNVFFKVSHSQ